MARKAFLICHVVGGLAVVNVSETPTMCRGILFRVLDHKLYIFDWPRRRTIEPVRRLVVLITRIALHRRTGLETGLP